MAFPLKTQSKLQYTRSFFPWHRSEGCVRFFFFFQTTGNGSAANCGKKQRKRTQRLMWKGAQACVINLILKERVSVCNMRYLSVKINFPALQYWLFTPTLGTWKQWLALSRFLFALCNPHIFCHKIYSLLEVKTSNIHSLKPVSPLKRKVCPS